MQTVKNIDFFNRDIVVMLNLIVLFYFGILTSFKSLSLFNWNQESASS